MPSRPRRREAPTFYLDTSTLCHAFRSVAVGGGTIPSSAEFQPLIPWIERLAHEANLCLSPFHLMELAQWEDRPTSNAMAEWLDLLPIVWMRSSLELREMEDDHWVKIAAGVRPAESVDAFVPSALCAFKAMSIQAVVEAMRWPNFIPHAVQELRRLATKRATTMQEVVRQFHLNRRWARDQGWSAKRRRDYLSSNLRIELRRRALAADERLRGRLDFEYLSVKPNRGAVQDLLVEMVAQEPLAMPSWRVNFGFAREFADVAAVRTPESRKARELDSSFADQAHLACAGGYCDVFTCDALTSFCIGNTRTQVGLRPQLALGGDCTPARFVSALMATWPAAAP